MALYEQWLSYQKQSLINKGVNLHNICDEDISFYFFEYYFRTLQQIPYTVHFSNELIENSLYEQFKDVITDIRDKATNADDLLPYLSKGIKRVQRPDKMLNDWGVLHCHLGNNIDASGFISRTNELLFIYRDVMNRPNELYFLDIFNHGDWSKKRTIEIIKNNWSDILEPHQIKRVLAVSPNFDEDKHLFIRDANMNSAITFDDGTAYLHIGGGLTGLGTNMHSTDSKIYFMKYFQNREREIIDTYRINPDTLQLRVDPFPHVYINQHFLNENAKVVPLEDIIIPKI